jgi:hypothetical protein
MESTWTITELASAAATALSGEPAQANGRVRDMPNERLIRWYTTIGLVDPPAGRRGRIALYGHRHLLQLVAVKRRQAEGRTIAQIQVELAGATNATLQSIARLPASPAPIAEAPAATPTPASAAVPGGVPDAGHGERRRFWTPPRDHAVVRAPESLTTAGSRRGMGGEESPSLVHGLRLAPGVTLLLDTGDLDPEDVTAIEIAARPLLEALRDRGLPNGSAATPPAPSASTGAAGAETHEPSAQSPTGRSS